MDYLFDTLTPFSFQDKVLDLFLLREVFLN